jgi:cytoskeletal protein CcmA (bactofilin family)
MFGKIQKEELPNAKTMNLFSAGTVIEGDVTADGDIRVDGRIKGTVTSRAKIVVGATGIIEGDLFSLNATIDGRVNGNVEIGELLILSKTAHVNGDLIIKKLVVEEGAKFNGNCRMGVSVARNAETEQEQKTYARPLKSQSV